MIRPSDYEVFKFNENVYTEIVNNGKTYFLNKHPYLDVVLTDNCNSNCSFCIADLIHEKLDGDFEIMKAKIKYAVDHLHVKEVLLLGGEPTVSPLLIPMIQHLKTLNLDKIIMTTNGVKLAYDAKFREEVMSAGLTNINISFMNINIKDQHEITHCPKHRIVMLDGLERIYKEAVKYGVKVRINNNIFKGNNDTVAKMLKFYVAVKPFCDSLKFSPLFPVDKFSVINVKTEWVKDNILTDDYVERLFTAFEKDCVEYHRIGIIENELQFGFVKNTLIPLKVPIIMNWNFGKYTSMMKKVVEEHKINNLKLLPNNELSLSWNRELREYFINTDM